MKVHDFSNKELYPDLNSISFYKTCVRPEIEKVILYMRTQPFTTVYIRYRRVRLNTRKDTEGKRNSMPRTHYRGISH